MKITEAQAQGQRPYQEDRKVVYTDSMGGKMLAVFDGHGSHTTAGTVATALPELHEKVSTVFHYPEALKFLFKELVSLTEDFESGTTASIVYIPNDHSKAYVAILGDSPVLILDKDLNLNVSPEHNVRTNYAELQAAQDRGAVFDGHYIRRGFSGLGLQMSRALGDAFLDGILNREPEVYTVELGPKSFVLLASDGLLDPSHKDTQEELKKLKYLIGYDASAKTLVNNRIERGAFDNVTAILVRMDAIETFIYTDMRELKESVAA